MEQRRPYKSTKKGTVQGKLATGTRGQGLRPQEIKFIDEYMANGFNATRAYKEVFKKCTEHAAAVESSRFLRKPNVAKEINYRLSAQQITNDAILHELWDIATNYRGAKTINAAVNALNILAKCRGMVQEVKGGDQFFQNNYLVYAPITKDNDNKDIKEAIESQGRMIE